MLALAEEKVLPKGHEVTCLVLEDDAVEAAVEAIRKAAETGRIGDGKIFVSNIEEIVRIRTGERGSDAI